MTDEEKVEPNEKRLNETKWRQIDEATALDLRKGVAAPHEKGVPHWDRGGYAQVVYDRSKHAHDPNPDKLVIDHIAYWYQKHPQTGETVYFAK